MLRSMCRTSAGAAKAAGKRPYEKWSDAEEDTFFLALKATAGCLPNVVCTAAAKRIGTKDYIQVVMHCKSKAPVTAQHVPELWYQILQSRLSV